MLGCFIVKWHTYNFFDEHDSSPPPPPTLLPPPPLLKPLRLFLFPPFPALKPPPYASLFHPFCPSSSDFLLIILTVTMATNTMLR